MVCPDCGACYHMACWNQSGRCVSPACCEGEKARQNPATTEQSDDPEHVVAGDVKSEADMARQANPVSNQLQSAQIVCAHCGNILTSDQIVCPACGTAVVPSPVISPACPRCGAALQPGQAFCAVCGSAVVPGDYVPAGYSATSVAKRHNGGRIALLVISILLGMVAVAAALVFLLPKLLVSNEELLAQGQYLQAYERASEEEKTDILNENQIAIICNEVVDGLKDPTSFQLREAWIDTSNEQIVLEVGAKNSYGGFVVNYWYYTFDDEENEYSLYTTLTDLDEEEYYSWDDTEDRLEKLLKNLARTKVESIMEDDNLKLSSESIDNINQLFENDLLDSIEEIPQLRKADGEEA